MSLQNTFEYRSSFSKIIEVNAYHEFYTDRILRGVTYEPYQETSQTLRNYNLLFKNTGNGFVVLSSNNVLMSSPSFSGALTLKFRMVFKDELFLNITSIPFKYNQLFAFKNDYPDTKLLHPNVFVDESSIQPSSRAGIFGEIEINFNGDNAFFGHEEANKKLPLLSYSINFYVRTVQTRYNFYSANDNTDLGNFYVINNKNNEQLKDFQSRYLENGMKVNTLILEESYPLKDRYGFEYYLKKEDEFDKSFSKYIPQPTIKNISMDASNGKFYNDVFLSVD